MIFMVLSNPKHPGILCKQSRESAVALSLIHLPAGENSVRIPKLLHEELEGRVALGDGAGRSYRCSWAHCKDLSASSSSIWCTGTAHWCFLGITLQRDLAFPCELYPRGAGWAVQPVRSRTCWWLGFVSHARRWHCRYCVGKVPSALARAGNLGEMLQKRGTAKRDTWKGSRV